MTIDLFNNLSHYRVGIQHSNVSGICLHYLLHANDWMQASRPPFSVQSKNSEMRGGGTDCWLCAGKED